VAGLRARLALHGRVVLSVGNLIPLKGHDLVIRAVAGIDDATLCIVGDGPERASLSRLTEELGISLRVRFLGEMAQDRLAEYYNAADVTVLASSNEGLPNVILESMACGTQVIATRVGGVPEVMTNPTMGVMVEQRHPDAIREAILNRPAKTPEHAAQVRECVSGFDWDVTACRLRKLFSRLCRDQMPTARLAAAKEE
jgi:glycosyltransferase involved in cell wall biosynthesis